MLHGLDAAVIVIFHDVWWRADLVDAQDAAELVERDRALLAAWVLARDGARGSVVAGCARAAMDGVALLERGNAVRDARDRRRRARARTWPRTCGPLACARAPWRTHGAWLCQRGSEASANSLVVPSGPVASVRPARLRTVPLPPQGRYVVRTTSSELVRWSS